jgi:hypothetical protein
VGYLFSGDSFYKFDNTTNTFIKLSSYGGGSRYNSVGFCFNNMLFIGLGNVSGNSEGSKDFWEYNTITDGWRRLNDFPGQNKICLISYTIDKKIYIGGGYRLSNNYSDFWEYDYSKNEWIKKTNLPAQVYQYNCNYFTYNNEPYLLFKTALWRYNIYFDYWEQINSLNIIKWTNGFNICINNEMYIGEYFYGYNGDYLKIWKFND